MTLDPRNDPTAPGGAAEQLAAKDKRIKELEEEKSELETRIMLTLGGPGIEKRVGRERWICSECGDILDIEFKRLPKVCERCHSQLPFRRIDSSRPLAEQRPMTAANPAAPCIVTAKNLGWCAQHEQELYHCIRALEAELAAERKHRVFMEGQARRDAKSIEDANARAEKAEAELAEAKRAGYPAIPKARVRELEKERDG